MAISIFFNVLIITAWADEIPVPVFNGDLNVSSNSGQIKLIWNNSEATDTDITRYRFELQKSTDSLFKSVRIIYKGQDLASFISGLPNGTYYFRVRAVDIASLQAGDWSEPLRLNVQHQSLKLAFILFGLGAIVFLATSLLIYKGTRKHIKDN